MFTPATVGATGKHKGDEGDEENPVGEGSGDGGTIKAQVRNNHKHAVQQQIQGAV